MITEEIMPCLQGAVPSTMVTCSKAGEPNTTVVSQVYYVDENHVALSFQFFNKSIRNIRENPLVSLQVLHPVSFNLYDLEITYSHTESEGNVFDQMDMQLEAIASMTGMTGTFKLLGADIYKVNSIKSLNWY